MPDFTPPPIPAFGMFLGPFSGLPKIWRSKSLWNPPFCLAELFAPLPPKFICWRHNPQRDSIWGLWEVIQFGWGHEGGILVKRNQGLAHCLWAVWGYEKMVPICKSGRGILPGTQCPGTLILNSLGSRTVRNTHLWSKPPSLWQVLQ